MYCNLGTQNLNLNRNLKSTDVALINVPFHLGTVFNVNAGLWGTFQLLLNIVR